VVGDVAKSGPVLADLRPALLWALINVCPGTSRRARLAGRADPGVVALFADGGWDDWRKAGGGARFTDIEGEGDERDGVTPLVWILGGTGRLGFVAPGVAAAAPAFGSVAQIGSRQP
jgi:hypothetical protein